MDFSGYQINNEEGSPSNWYYDGDEEEGEVLVEENQVPPKLMCDTCEREFQTYYQYQKHMSEHRVCGIDGCSFTAHEKIIEKHYQTQHCTGLYEKIRNVMTPEDIAKWIADRKKNYPKKENIEKRYKQQEEMLKRGEKLGRNEKRFDKGNKTRFTVKPDNSRKRHQSSSSQKPPRKKVKIFNKKPVSLINDKSDWNGTLFPFKGTTQLYKEEPTNVEEDFDDEEWQVGCSVIKLQSIPIKNALGALMSSYNSCDSDLEENDTEPNKSQQTKLNSIVATSKNEQNTSNDESPEEQKIQRTEIAVPNQNELENTVPQVTESIPIKNGLGALMSSYKSCDSDLEEDEIEPNGFQQTKLNSIVASSKTEQKTNNDKPPEEHKIERTPIAIPATSNQDESKSFVPQVTGKRKRRTRGKKNKKGVTKNQPSTSKINNQTGFNQPIYKKRKVTLLERLLANEIRHERNVLLQCVKFVVSNNFFQDNQDCDEPQTSS